MQILNRRYAAPRPVAVHRYNSVLLAKKRSRSKRLGALVIVAALLGGGLWFEYWRAPAPGIPVPKDFDRLDPQLRAYVAQKLNWVREKPRLAQRHAALGLIYGVNGLWTEAQQAFQIATRLDAKDPLAQLYVGVSSQELGDFVEAAKIFHTLAGRFPKFGPAYYRLGYALLRTDNLDEAEKAFKRLTELAPEEWRGYAGLGEVMLRKKQSAVAAQLLEKAIQLDSTAKTAHHLLGQAYQQLGRRSDAEVELQLGRNAVDSPMPDTWGKTAAQHIRILQGQVQLANDYSEGGEPRKAVEILAKAFQFHPDDVGLMNQLAIALNRSDQPHKARMVLTGALEKNDRYVPAIITLSLCQQKLNENEAALATAERAISLAPKITQGYVAKANALLALERDEDAVKTLEVAAQLDPQNAELPTEMGDILWRNLNRVKEAQERYETACKLDPVLAPAFVRLADLSLQLGEIDRARTSIARLRRLSPKLPELALLEQRLRRLDGR